MIGSVILSAVIGGVLGLAPWAASRFRPRRGYVQNREFVEPAPCGCDPGALDRLERRLKLEILSVQVGSDKPRVDACLLVAQRADKNAHEALELLKGQALEADGNQLKEGKTNVRLLREVHERMRHLQLRVIDNERKISAYIQRHDKLVEQLDKEGWIDG